MPIHTAIAPVQAAVYSILVVDDNPANSHLIAAFFSDYALQVDVARSGKQALELCKSTEYSLIFMDVNMPEMDGFATTQHIRAYYAKGQRIPIVALTAHAVDECKVQILLADMDDYVSKPVNFESLVAILGCWLGWQAVAQIGIDLNAFLSTPMKLEAAEPSVLLNTPISTLYPDGPDIPPVVIADCLRLAREKPQLAADLLSVFIKSVPQALLDVMALQKACDWEGLAGFVHKFYGGTCYVGTPRVQAATKNLNQCLKNQHYEQLPLRVARFCEACQALEDWASEHDVEALFL